MRDAASNAMTRITPPYRNAALLLSQPLSGAPAARSQPNYISAPSHSTVRRKNLKRNKLILPQRRARGRCTLERGSRRSSSQKRESASKNSGETRFLRQIHLGNSRSPDPARWCFSEWPPLLVWRKSAAETEMLRSVQPIGERRHYNPSYRGGADMERCACAARINCLPARMLHAPLGFKGS